MPDRVPRAPRTRRAPVNVWPPLAIGQIGRRGQGAAWVQAAAAGAADGGRAPRSGAWQVDAAVGDEQDVGRVGTRRAEQPEIWSWASSAVAFGRQQTDALGDPLDVAVDRYEGIPMPNASTTDAVFRPTPGIRLTRRAHRAAPSRRGTQGEWSPRTSRTWRSDAWMRGAFCGPRPPGGDVGELSGAGRSRQPSSPESPRPEMPAPPQPGPVWWMSAPRRRPAAG